MWLKRLLLQATVVSLVLSDVIGDPLGECAVTAQIRTPGTLL
jgi:glycerate-2-kinase